MNINYYRKANVQGYIEAWKSCLINDKTDLGGFTAEPLITINGQPILRQHHVTYLTGRETCRAHHFAKHLAVQILSKDVNTPSSQSSPSSQSTGNRCKVLWVDTVHGPHVAATIYQELVEHAACVSDLQYVCLDVLGSKREDFSWVGDSIMTLVSELKPILVIIDDIDHFMPYGGIKSATDFCRSVRDEINHNDTAFLFIGYNHLGKKACTTGILGKHLFLDAGDIFSLSTVRDVTTVRHVYGFDMRCDPDSSEYRFTIGSDNLPQEVNTLPVSKPSPINDDSLCDIVDGVLSPGQDITAAEFVRQVGAQHSRQRQQDRDTALINQALRLNLIIPAGNDRFTVGQKCGNTLTDKEIETAINTSLTLPTHPIPSPAVSAV